jgi:hypothetical protein
MQPLPLQLQQDLQTHPYYYTYTDFQKPYDGFFTTQHLGNNVSTDASNYAGEFPISSNYRYAGGYMPGDRFMSYNSAQSVAFISKMITRGLHGVHPEGKNIIVPEATIRSVMDSIFQNTGQSAEVMQQMVINYIVDAIKTEYETEKRNNSYSAWVQKYDQETGMKQFSDVKLNNKMRSPYMQFRY